ncbi:MAG TPA: hypothetical protein VF691_06670 [Cytophagaceae bacterium]
MQSHLGEVSLLPAIPEQWQSGRVKGLRARGGFEVAIDWKQGKVSHATIKSLKGGRCQLRTNTPVRVKGSRAEVKTVASGYVLTFDTEEGKTYSISPR